MNYLFLGALMAYYITHIIFGPALLDAGRRVLCNQLRQSVCQSVSQSQKFSYFLPLDFSDFLHQVSPL